VAIWRRPKLTARGDPYHDHVVAGIVARLIDLPRRAVVLAEDETHLNLLPHVRASWTLRGTRPQVLTPGTNRKVTVLGALEMSTGAWVYRLGRRRAADFIALLDQLLQAFKNYVANTAVTWPGRLRQIHSFFRNRSPDQMLATAAPWTSPWLPPGYEQNFWNAA
jgi:DDE superfamily endonuclease